MRHRQAGGEASFQAGCARDQRSREVIATDSGRAARQHVSGGAASTPDGDIRLEIGGRGNRVDVPNFPLLFGHYRQVNVQVVGDVGQLFVCGRS